MKSFELISDQQWTLLEPVFSQIEKQGPGKPHIEWRRVLNSILHWKRYGKWDAIPSGSQDFASKSTAHRWYLTWNRNGFSQRINEVLQSNIGIKI